MAFNLASLKDRFKNKTGANWETGSNYTVNPYDATPKNPYADLIGGDTGADFTAMAKKKAQPLAPQNVISPFTRVDTTPKVDYSTFASGSMANGKDDMTVKPVTPNYSTDSVNKPLSNITNQFGTITFDANGLPTLVEDPNKTAQSYADMKLAEVAKEYARRMTEAENLYNSTMSNLGAERAGVDPRYKDTVDTIGTQSFNTAENAKELMNMYGWGMGNSGLAVGEVGKIGIQKDKDLAKAQRDRDMMLADIARREATAKNLKESGISESKAWQSAQKMGVEAEAFLKGKEAFKSAYETMRNNWKDNANVDQVKANTELTKKTVDAKDFENNTTIEDVARKRYRELMLNRGEGFDYSQAIKDVQNDNDPTNDWQIGILEEGKTNKLNTRKSNFDQSVMQYFNDFQQAINNLDTSDPLYGYKKSMLENARKIKVDEMQKRDMESKKFNEGVRQFDTTLEEQVRNRLASYALQRQQNGISQDRLNWEKDLMNPENKFKQAQIDNLSQKSNTMTAPEKEKSFNEDYVALSKLPQKDAINELTNGKDDYIITYGLDSYKKLYNEVLKDAIKNKIVPAMDIEE